MLHTAYGRIGDADVGGAEIIGYDAASKKYKSYFFDSQGNMTTDEFTIQGDTCILAGEKTRATAVLEDNGKTQKVLHERLDESGKWVPAMDVTLRKVE